MPGPAITPRLIHPQAVVIEQVDKASTTWDDTLREPVVGDWPVADGSVPSPLPTQSVPEYSAPVNLQAQVKYVRAKEMEHSKVGDVPRGDGHLFFEAAALTTAGITLQKGDRCISISGGAVEFYFVDIIPMGHYDTPYFIKAVFIRRKEGIAGVRSGGLK